MQKRYEEEQQLLVYLEETVEACYIKHVAQKARKEIEAKTRKNA